MEGDITACFDEISHSALLCRLRRRVGDKRVLALVKSFLKAGVLTEDGAQRDTITGTPQGGLLSPLLANIALHDLDEHFARAWAEAGPTHAGRRRRRRQGLPNYRLIRYADDFVALVSGTKADTEALREEVAAVLAPIGLRLSATKTKIAHIDEGFDFLGFRIQRHQKRGTAKKYVYTYPSKAALLAVMDKVRTISQQDTNQPLAVLLHQINPVLRGWTTYFRHGSSKATFSYLGAFGWRRVIIWLRRKHPHANWKQLRQRYLPGWRPTQGEVRLFDPASVTVSRYRYRGRRIPSPWTSGDDSESGKPRMGFVESPVRG